MVEKIIDSAFYIIMISVIIVSMYIYNDEKISITVAILIIAYMIVREIIKNKGILHIVHLRRGIRAIAISVLILSLTFIAIYGDTQYISGEETNVAKCNIKNYMDKGYIVVENKNEEPVVVQVIKDGNPILYNCYIENDGFEHNILLSQGKGNYEVIINIKVGNNNMYAVIAKYKSYYDDSDNLFSMGSYNVESSKFKNSINILIKKEGWLASTENEVIFNYFSKYKYDKELESRINNNEFEYYITDVENTIDNKKGVCIDIASAIACVERTLGREARICVGAEDNGTWHSWCEVYDNGKWKPMDTLRQSKYGENYTNGIKVVQYY